MTKINALPREFFVRAPTMYDLEAVTDLIAACDVAEWGEPEFTLEDMRADWRSPEIDLETDAWVVLAPEGRPVGYAAVFNRENVRFYADVFVHPEHCGRGIGTHLAQLSEARARQLEPEASPETRVNLLNTISSVNEAGRRLLEDEGYTLARHFWRMRIEMDEMPPPAEWHNGVRIRTFVPDQDDYATFEAMEESFKDHWGYLPWRFDSFKQGLIEREDFDPNMWFLAMDGDKIAGGALCHSYPNEGWINILGVRHPWRRQGLGLGLLLHSFREFYRHGQRKVSLGVDSQNETGATRLYRRAGMQVVRQFDTYEKELRPGKDPSKQ